MGGKRMGGQVTVMAALSLTLILSLVAVVFRSVKQSSLNVHIQQSCRLATEAVFSGYSNVILDEYDVLLLKKSDMMDGKLSQYIEDNIAYEKEAKLVTAKFDTVNMVTDHGGDGIRREIVAYMKYGVMSDAVNALLQSEEQVKKSEKINEITEQITNCEETVYETDAQIMKLISLVEGVETVDSGLVIRNGKPQPVSEYFVKATIYGEVTKASAAVDNQLVYDAVNHVTTLYTNVDDIISNMLSDVEDLEDVGDEKSDGLGENMSYSATYKKSYEQLETLIKGSEEKTDEALKVLESYKADTTVTKDTIDSTKKQVEESKEIIGETLAGDILSDLNEMSGAVSTTKRKMCDVAVIEEGLKDSKGKLNAVSGNLSKLDVELKKSDCTNVKTVLQQCQSTLKGLSNTKLKFDYSGVDFNSESDGLSAIEKLYSTLTDGLLRLVLEDKTVSEKKVNGMDLASKLTGDKSEESNLAIEALDTALFDQYILDRFSTYTDFLDEDGNYDESRVGSDLLDYSLEYIICGEDSDQENLKETMLRLSMIREGMNLAYLLTDTGKKAEALTLANTLLGFTGNMAIIKGAQYLILTVWAYGESIIELKSLYDGNKVDMVKTKDQWKLSLQNLLTSTFDSEQTENKTGFDYEGYLRMLLFIENTVEKNYQTMGAMECRIIGKGNVDFRMKDYVFAASGQAVFTRNGMKGLYTREIQYTYA